MMAAAAGEAQTSQMAVEKISYDSGTELESPKEFVFHEYWSDKAGEINWKTPISKRGMIYNSSLPSADGRDLFMTTLQSWSRTACGSRCPVRVLTAQHKKIIDILACADRTQHGVSIDHRSFVACGESFPIPQVDDRTAIMENAAPDSNAEAYVEVVRRQRSKPANAPEPIHVDSAYHNNSEMLISEWKDATVEITYNHPRPGLPVAEGTLLFRGVRDGAHYSGTAYTFKAGCSHLATFGRMKVQRWDRGRLPNAELRDGNKSSPFKSRTHPNILSALVRRLNRSTQHRR